MFSKKWLRTVRNPRQMPLMVCNGSPGRRRMQRTSNQLRWTLTEKMGGAIWVLVAIFAFFEGLLSGGFNKVAGKRPELMKIVR